MLRNPRQISVLLAVLAGLLAVVASLARPTFAAERVYWTNSGAGGGPQAISFAGLDGSGGGDLSTAGATVNFPIGVALDPAAGRIYWANFAFGAGTQSISFAGLDGSGGGDLSTSGATLNTPAGLATDPAAGRIYWANTGAGGGPQGISFASLDGSGGGDLNTAGATLSFPAGVAVDPGTGRIYWANNGGGGPQGISFASLDGSGGGDLNTAGATLSSPTGVAVDPAAGRIYWANGGTQGGPQGISFARLDGSGGGDLTTPGATLNFPFGVALDPGAGRIYWGDVALGGGPAAISLAALDGSGGADLPTPGATQSGPAFPALLKAPVGSGAPQVSGGAKAHSRLSCSQGSWASDLLPSLLYRAPHTLAYQWSRNNKAIHAAKASTYRPHAVGNYRCTVNAENQAGSSSQTSARHVAFRFGRLIRDRTHGTAKLIVKVPGPGNVILTGKKVKKQKRRGRLASKAKHLYKALLRIRTKGSATRKLRRTGGAEIKLKVTYRLNGGAAGTRTGKMTLTRR